MDAVRRTIMKITGRGSWERRTSPKRHERGDVSSWKLELSMLYRRHSNPFKLVQLHAARRDAVHRIHRIAQGATDQQLAQLELKHLLWTTVGLFCYFRALHSYDPSYRQRRDYHRISRLFTQLLRRLLNSNFLQHVEVLQSLLCFCAERKLWVRESLVVSLLLRPLSMKVSLADLLTLLLDRLKKALRRRRNEARNIVRVMYEVFDLKFWPKLDKNGMDSIKSLLNTYRRCVHMEHGIWRKPNPLAPGLRKGLEVVVRCIAERLANNDLLLVLNNMLPWIETTKQEKEMYVLASVMEHVVLVHDTGLYEDTFSGNLFHKLLRVIGNNNVFVSRLGNRIMQLLLDRHDNCDQFTYPQIFFQNTHFNVRVCSLKIEDEAFLKKYRAHIHNCLMNAFLQHSRYLINMNSLYKTMCLLATEVPCGYTAAVIANLVMNVQAAARAMVTHRSTTKYQMNALVVSVMSLLCWLHNAPDLYNYVNKIVNIRAAHAPYLNPPLRLSYKFAQHHVVYERKDLFFDEWEVRYSLWMRFRLKHAVAFLRSMGAEAPPNDAELAAAAATVEPSLVAHVATPTRRELLRPFLRPRPRTPRSYDDEDSDKGQLTLWREMTLSAPVSKSRREPAPMQWPWVRYQSANLDASQLSAGSDITAMFASRPSQTGLYEEDDDDEENGK